MQVLALIIVLCLLGFSLVIEDISLFMALGRLESFNTRIFHIFIGVCVCTRVHAHAHAQCMPICACMYMYRTQVALGIFLYVLACVHRGQR